MTADMRSRPGRYGRGRGFGAGESNGRGAGWGASWGAGNAVGRGWGYGYGYGHGLGDGPGTGAGSGYGWGRGDGAGWGGGDAHSLDLDAVGGVGDGSDWGGGTLAGYRVGVPRRGILRVGCESLSVGAWRCDWRRLADEHEVDVTPELEAEFGALLRIAEEW